MRDLALLSENETQVVARLRVVGTEPDGCLERWTGVINVAGPPPRRAEVILGVEESRLKLDRAGKMLERCVSLAELSAHVAKPIVRSGKIWRSLKRTFVHCSRADEVPGLFLGVTEQDQGLSKILFRCPLHTALLRGARNADRACEQNTRCTRRDSGTFAHSSTRTGTSQPLAGFAGYTSV